MRCTIQILRHKIENRRSILCLPILTLQCSTDNKEETVAHFRFL